MSNHVLCDPYGSPGSSVHEVLQARLMSGLSSPSLGDLPDQGIEPTSSAAPALQMDSLPLSQQGNPTKD